MSVISEVRRNIMKVGIGINTYYLLTISLSVMILKFGKIVDFCSRNVITELMEHYERSFGLITIERTLSFTSSRVAWTAEKEKLTLETLPLLTPQPSIDNVLLCLSILGLTKTQFFINSSNTFITSSASYSKSLWSFISNSNFHKNLTLTRRRK